MSEGTTSRISGSNFDDVLDWNFLQCFGERTPGEEVQDADIISAVEFDRHGDHLATGDRGGRVVLFEKIPVKQSNPGMEQRGAEPRPPCEYRYLTEFQSHEPEFDYLKSLEIEEKINKVRWANQRCASHLLLSTNDKTIKLWKVYEKRVVNLVSLNTGEQRSWSIPASSGTWRNGAMAPVRSKLETLTDQKLQLPLRIPKVTGVDAMLTSRCRRLYSNGHAYHINSISCASDDATFMSADDLRINLWHLEVTGQAFNVVDMKPPNMEDLTEVITCAEFHPEHSHIFGYSSSKGCIRLADMRSAALCDAHCKAFEDPETSGSRSFFSEIISSISDIRFSPNGRYLLSRDYMTLKLWDLAMETSPLASYPVHDHLRNRLCDLYENDCIFDKFDCCMSETHSHVATGSYGNTVRVTSTMTGASAVLESTRDPLNKKASTKGSSRFGLGRAAPNRNAPDGTPPFQTSDLAAKMLHLAWHPEEDVIAAAASNSLYMFCAP